MKLRYLTLALGLTGLISACDQIPLNPEGQGNTAAVAAPVKDDSPVMASVNGTPITENMFVLYQKQRQSRRPNDVANQNPRAVLEEIINLELARQNGEQQGVDKDTEIMLQIDQQRRAVIATAAIQKELETNPITDEELKKIYDDNVGGGNEYKARHILVKEEEEAKKLIAELDGGADFSELAKQHSTGPTGKNGGDLGWFSAQQMVEPFSEAVAAMEKGSYTKEPVQTQFGWHVIMLDDTRETTPPSFDQLKPQLQMLAQNQRVQEYLTKLRDSATIEIKTDFGQAEQGQEDSGAAEGDHPTD